MKWLRVHAVFQNGETWIIWKLGLLEAMRAQKWAYQHGATSVEVTA